MPQIANAPVPYQPTASDQMISASTTSSLATGDNIIPVDFSFSGMTNQTFTHNFGRKARVTIVMANGIDSPGGIKRTHTNNTVQLESNQPIDGILNCS